MLKKVLILSISLALASAGAVLCFIGGKWLCGSVLCLISIFCIYTLAVDSRKDTKKLIYLLQALKAHDTSFKFTGKSNDSYDRLFNQSLNQLREMIERERELIRNQERFFGVLLDRVNLGILAVKDNGSVAYCNNKALELIGLGVLTHLVQLSRIESSLPQKFDSLDEGGELIFSFLNEKGESRLSVNCSRTRTDSGGLRIMVINDIGNQLENSELDSWTKLIRVLTHEIMNTVTPIASLSDTLQNLYGQRDDEIDQGLKVISSSCRGLISFVESYRKLSRLSVPLRTACSVADLVRENISLMQQSFAEHNIECRFETADESILIFADGGMISQVIINLLRNAAQAGAHKIIIRSFLDAEENVNITLANDGPPISKESRDQIFIPFYTTKSIGTGIGLSLSKQIMRLHSGSLQLLGSSAEETVFALIFK